MLEPILDHFGRLTAPDYIQAGVGFLLLALGKRLFWLAVGGLGFAVSLHLSLLLLPAQPAETRLALGLVAGVLGIVLALAIQKLAVAVAGFALGALVVASALPWVWPEAGVWLIPAAGAGGIAGLMRARPFFELALVVITSAAGALLVAGVASPEPRWAPALALVLFVAGLAVQLRRDGDDDD